MTCAAPNDNSSKTERLMPVECGRRCHDAEAHSVIEISNVSLRRSSREDRSKLCASLNFKFFTLLLNAIAFAR
ncbi:hypothetical protein TrVGV298_002138 [Trichoderma virens]|nr:hypothetical protein TrVGV298_002138 [Trichoderma virens]